jgi:DNA-binding MarR family transcriptional regulator/GNAT superfamily N-acetyltransferase
MTTGLAAALQQRIAAVRQFNRFYTQQIGVLREGHLDSAFSLTQVRVLYEIAYRQRPTAGEIARDLGLNAGYLSRILRGFERRGLIDRKPSEEDGRQHLLWLTEAGLEIFLPLDALARQEVAAMLDKLAPTAQDRLLAAMGEITVLLGGRPEPKVSYVLRPHQPGDMGWIVYRHGVLFTTEYGLDARFEALVAEITAKFLRDYDPRWERCWIAEREGEIVGSVFVVRQSAAVARLRLLLVEPGARGLGIGTRLVEECVGFARQAGYRTLMLWTQNHLHSARRLYTQAGFRCVQEEHHTEFGPELIGETWELEL